MPNRRRQLSPKYYPINVYLYKLNECHQKTDMPFQKLHYLTFYSPEIRKNINERLFRGFLWMGNGAI
ncbi:hypothetical protein FKM82_021113 [Ascaphus truei]